MKKIAVCCMSGGYKNVFAQGVLTALEQAGFRADAYAACSSSALIAAMAAVGRTDLLDLSLWEEGYAASRRDAGDQSRAMLHSIERLAPEIVAHLWKPKAARLLIATSFVKTDDGARITQSDNAKRQGQVLLVHALRHNPAWKEQHLEPHLFDTRPVPATRPLTPDNFAETAYATTRMLHAWSIPATIGGLPYIDGSYTSLCPAREAARLGYARIVCISTEPNGITTDLFSAEMLPERIGDSVVEFLKPPCELKQEGVDFYTIAPGALQRVYDMGLQAGAEYLHNAAFRQDS